MNNQANYRIPKSYADMIHMVIYTWNSNGLFCCDPIQTNARNQYIEQISKIGTAIAIQETHDDGDTASHHFEQLHSSFEIYTSSLAHHVGGVLLAIRNTYWCLFETKQKAELIAGRVLAVILSGTQ